MYTKLLDPLLPGFFGFLFNRLTTSWNAISARPHTTEKTTEAVTNNEIIEEAIVRELTRQYFDWIKVVLRIGGLEPSEPMSVNLSELCRHFISSEAIALPLIYSVINGLSWPDSLSAHKAVEICLHLVTFLLENPRYHPILAKEVLTAVLRAMMNNSTDSFTSLISIARDIYWTLRITNVGNDTRDLFLSLPNVTPTNLDELNRAMETQNPKKQKFQLRAFLLEVVGINTAVSKKQNILNMPDKLFVTKMTDPSWTDTAQDFDLSKLWETK